MIEWPCNELRNHAAQIILCAFSSGGTIFDDGKWTVKKLLPVRMVDDKDIDYIGPCNHDISINGQLGWWKLFHGMTYGVAKAAEGNGLTLGGFYPRKHTDPPNYSFVREWRGMIDETDTNFGTPFPGRSVRWAQGSGD